MKRALLLTYLVTLHVALGVAVLRPDMVRSILGGERPHIAEMKAIHGRIAPTIPQGAAIFLGDSITEGLAAAAVAPYAVNLGIGGLRTDQLLENLPTYPLDHASRIYLMIGINDLGQGKAAGIDTRMQQIANQLPPVPVVWTGVMPARRDVVRPEVVAETNAAVQRECAKLPSCTYIDPAPIFGANGQADPALYADAVHLNEEGYRRWIHLLTSAQAPPPAT